jgi:hypothetical protein
MSWRRNKWAKWKQNPGRVDRCGATRKVCFRSHDAALQRCGELQCHAVEVGQIERRAVPQRAYRCQLCGFYHISSTPN